MRNSSQGLDSGRCIPKARGFTLLELLVTVAIAAIILAVGVPSLIEQIDRNAVIAEARNLSGDMAWARSQAITANRIVTVCGKTDGANDCVTNGNGDDWLFGWIVFHDDGAGGAGVQGDGQRNGDEEVLRVFDDSKDNALFVIDTDTDFVSSISFDPRGHLDGAIVSGAFNDSPNRMSMTICDDDGTEEYARALIVERTGRTTPSRDADGNGIHENARGDQIVCD